MNSLEIRNKFINYFIKNNHKQVDSAPVIPEGDSSVLFTTAGMQQFVPYFLGENHPKGDKLVDYQKCLRTNDIDEVGDNRHLTFFEMLGNWSIGSYFKEEAIKYSYEFLTKELNIDPDKLSVTCFIGDEDSPKDLVAFEAWKAVGIPEDRIYFFGKDDNWWIAGETGPCGPDTEIFYDTGKEACGENCDPSCDCGKYIEIWNNVFMEYYKDENGYRKLTRKNVDTGMGLERISMLLQGLETPFDLEMFKPTMEFLKENAKNDLIESRRIVSEHLRTACIIIADGGMPSNIDRGYVLRRLIRRSIRHLRKLEVDFEKLTMLINVIIDANMGLYKEMDKEREKITSVISSEKDKFLKTLIRGEKEFEKIVNRENLIEKKEMKAETAFKLYETYGLPIEITVELAKDEGISVDTDKLNELFKHHQELSRAGSEKKFKGGLANTNEQTIKYHTATHLLHKSLQEILGKHATQKGSNITEERLRFDFAHPEKMTKEEIQKVEDLVNEKIKEGLTVTRSEMTVEEAKNIGAMGLFEDKYKSLGDKVSVYSMGDFSIEICGGPHVTNTNTLGRFKIEKEESSSKGVRRIKAKLYDENK